MAVNRDKIKAEAKRIEDEIRRQALGSADAGLTTFKTPLSRVLNAWGELLSVAMAEELSKLTVNKREDTDLANSITMAKPTIGIESISVEVLGADYWKYVNYGVNGINRDAKNNSIGPGTKRFSYSEASLTRAGSGKSHAEAIRDWIPRARVYPNASFIAKHGKSGNAKLYNSWAHAIARSIKNRGLKAKPFVSNTVTPKTEKLLSQVLLDVTGVAIDVRFLRNPQSGRESSDVINVRASSYAYK
jgi:hypothetical protein